MARKTYTEEDRARVRQALLDTGLGRKQGSEGAALGGARRGGGDFQALFLHVF